QSEAKSNLGNIRTAQEAYYAEKDAYSSSLTEIGFATKGTANYQYTAAAGGTGAAATFVATASATAGGKLVNDTWTIDNNGTLANPTNKCS
ncbi:MAG: type IV pilin-like G/H family protein, partial [Thermodesulfobacteriota bacterium]